MCRYHSERRPRDRSHGGEYGCQSHSRKLPNPIDYPYERYANKYHCYFILIYLSTDDIENQKAARLAKQVDPSGQRTIGVLTKPDTLTVGAVKSKENWLAVLEGHRFKTTHGYFCTRQPDDGERARGITAAQARAAEHTFFNSTAPWSTSQQRHRFGTEVLVDNLSRLLSKVIDERWV